MRKHKDFIQAFTEYHRDDFVPDNFYTWTAISLVAAALERKVWIPHRSGNFYPNMFVFLVAKPGMGKSSAMKKATKMIQKMNEGYGTLLKMLPNKVTEPKLLDLLKDKEYFMYNNNQYPHTSMYYFASEASTCFHDVYGGFTQTLTALYDGDDLTKATVSRKEEVKIINPCINILAGCTFDFLSKLLTTEGILGGFASRITYIVHDEMMDRQSNWLGNTNETTHGIEYTNLVDDLHKIHSLVGGFSADPEFIAAYEAWFPQFDQKLQSTPNEKLQALMVRKSTAMRKLPMILCASESDDMVLKKHHWEWALELMDSVESKIPNMIREGQSNRVNTQEGINAVIVKLLQKNGLKMTEDEMVSQAMLMGHTGAEVRQSVQDLVRGKELLTKKGPLVCLTGDANIYI